MLRINVLATVGMIAMIPMLVYYPYHALAWNLELSFLDPDRWTRNSAWVHPDAVIATSTRTVFFLLWAIPTLFGWLAYLTGFTMLWRLRRGLVFDEAIARSLTWMGGLIFLSSAGALFAGAVSPMVRSWHNPEGPLPLRFWYDSGNLGMIFCGLAFLFLGIVVHEAIRIARENEAFV